LPLASIVLLALNSASRDLLPAAIIREAFIAMVYTQGWFGLPVNALAFISKISASPGESAKIATILIE
jgi:hypothetical protein